MIKIFKFFSDIFWLHTFRKDQETDNYFGEITIFFLVYPYRMFVIGTLSLSIILGWQYSIPWLFCVVFYWGSKAIYSIKRVREYVDRVDQKNYEEYLEKMKKKQKEERERVLQEHLNDPPKKVTKVF